MLQLVLASFLSFNPLTQPITMPPETLQEAREWAVGLEVLGPKETYYFKYPWEFGRDLCIVLHRAAEADDYPSLQDVQLLPHAEYVREMIQLNRSCKYYAEGMLIASWEKDRLRAYLTALGEAYQIYDRVRDAQSDYLSPVIRRKALKELRDELLGWQAYYSGNVPPAVPIEFIAR